MKRECSPLNSDLLEAELRVGRKKEPGQYIIIESLYDQCQQVPELTGVVVDAYELQAQVLLSLENFVNK